MGIRGRGSADNIGLGRYTTLRPIVTNAAEEENDPDKIPNTRIIRISNEIYEKFLSHSQRFYDVESYNQILEILINEFESHNQEKSWRDIES